MGMDGIELSLNQKEAVMKNRPIKTHISFDGTPVGYIDDISFIAAEDEVFKMLQDKYGPSEILLSVLTNKSLELDGIKYNIKCFCDQLVAISSRET